MAPIRYNEISRFKDNAVASHRLAIRMQLGLGPDTRPCVKNYLHSLLSKAAQQHERKKSKAFKTQKAYLKTGRLLDRALEKVAERPGLAYSKGGFYTEEQKKAILLIEEQEKQAAIASKPVRNSVTSNTQLWINNQRNGLYMCKVCRNVYPDNNEAMKLKHRQTKKCINAGKKMPLNYEPSPAELARSNLQEQ